MKILEVDIENFKNHEKSVFHFTGGINAISGPNGAGKTSVIEAISWVLFDNKPYNTDGIVTRSSAPKVATVKVTFVSDLDKKEYIVCRNSKSLYYIVEKETNSRLAEKAGDVKYFLKKHYNLSDSIELSYMFTNTIGVPQGTFTSIFFDSATNRKKIFDKVLNLEDYRESFEYLSGVNTYIKDLLSKSEIIIASYKPFIDKKPELVLALNTFNLNATDIFNKISTNKDLLKNLEVINKDLDELSSKIINKDNEIKHLDSKVIFTKDKIERENIEYKEASNSLNRVKILRPLHNEYLEKKLSIDKEDKRKQEYEKLEKELLKLDKDIQGVVFKINTNKESLARLEELKQDIEKLAPSLLLQDELEKQKEELSLKQDEMKKNENYISACKKEINDLKEQLSLIEKELAKYDQLKTNAELFNAKSKSYQEEIEKKLELETSLSESKKMASIIKTGQCPFLNEDCKNIAEGQNLQEFFTDRINGLVKELKLQETSTKSLKQELDILEKDVNLLVKLDFQQNEYEKLLVKVKEKNIDLENTEKILNKFSGVPEKLSQIIDEIKKLGSPKDRIATLKDQIKNEETLKRSLALAEKNKEVLDNRLSGLKSEIEQINFDNDLYQKLKNDLANLEKSHQEYLINENKSKNLDQITLTINELQNELSKLIETKDNLNQDLSFLKANYDTDKHKQIKNQLESIKSELLKAKENKKYNDLEIARVSKELDEIEQKLTLSNKEISKINKINSLQSFLETSRDILKRCSPMVGKFYIENISNEASLLYKEIMQKDNQELIWNLDYEITIEESGLSRPFQNLSGGEQMAAAISVRLALLKELSDINIAFFDEPTTNMDEIRRNNLAEQIKNISSFDQIFIISHDDTFEKDIDNVIRLN